MEAVVGLLVMMVGVSHGVETYCNGTVNGTQCYGALGGSVVFKLIENFSGINKYQWQHAGITIFAGKRNKTTSTFKHRSVFTPNTGTYRLNNLEKGDSGEYILSLFDTNGVKTDGTSLHFTVQAPVSSVRLTTDCLSEGNKRAFCSSEEGDSPEYSWTLDGRTLTDTELIPGDNEANSISLKVHVSGELVCSVKNDVSKGSKGVQLSTCGFIFINCTSNGTEISGWVDGTRNHPCSKPTTITAVGKETVTPSYNITSSNQTLTTSSDEQWSISTLAILAAILSTLFLLAIVTAICIKRKNQSKKPQEEKEDQELTYAEVTIVQRPRRQLEQRSEDEVEYGQVKFSHQPEQIGEIEDDRVYARVRKGR